MVGLSGNPDRTAYRIAELLQHRGKRIVPVHRTALRPRRAGLRDAGRRAVPDRRRRRVPPLAGGRCLRRPGGRGGAKGVSFQLGMIDHDTSRRTTDAGVPMVMDALPRDGVGARMADLACASRSRFARGARGCRSQSSSSAFASRQAPAAQSWSTGPTPGSSWSSTGSVSSLLTEAPSSSDSARRPGSSPPSTAPSTSNLTATAARQLTAQIRARPRSPGTPGPTQDRRSRPAAAGSTPREAPAAGPKR